MKVLVTGVKGQLGFDVVNELEKRGHTAIGVDVDTMDITNSEQVESVIKANMPDPEEMPEVAEDINVPGKE